MREKGKGGFGEGDGDGGGGELGMGRRGREGDWGRETGIGSPPAP